ncbi:triose-phosphate isomerase family protein [Companilactobacillus muriivasis]|uniref:triose-phosphate isomerase family protein n=1 Tax=Companilactobacillus muriivasis TaxID=3081444 RepID=UPI0030C696FC
MTKSYIHVNLKRFDILKSLGGVNDLDYQNNPDWSSKIIKDLTNQVNQFSPLDYEFVFYLPEAYLISALNTRDSKSQLQIGCQSVFSKDVIDNGNIGAFTTYRPASAMASIGIKDTIVGHSEERAYELAFLNSVSSDEKLNKEAVQKDVEEKIINAQKAGMNVLYCVGESAEERDSGNWKAVLQKQLYLDFSKIDINRLKIAYEPIWAIGPNRPVPSGDKIQEVAEYIHSILNKDVPVLYGGGLKEANASEISKLPDVDGGLVALTNFSDHVGFHPDDFIKIVKKYNEGKQ